MKGTGNCMELNRIEWTWMRGQSSKGTNSDLVFEDDTRIDSLSLSAYYDFRESKKWSPFVGLTLASTKVEISGGNYTNSTLDTFYLF